MTGNSPLASDTAGDAARFAGNRIPDYYDRGLGPVLFAEYGERIARRAASYAPAHVLETAAGTGIVTRKLRDLLPAGAALVATDLNEAMIAVARTKFIAGECVEFRAADALALPFPDASFDVVVCQFGVMFYPDKNKSYREARRVLTDRGRYLFSVFDAFAFNPSQRVIDEFLASIFPADPPQFLRIPCGYANIDAIVASLNAGGFRDIRVDIMNVKSRVEDPTAYAAGFVLGSPLADQVRARGMDPLKLVDQIEQRLREHAFEDGCAPMRAILFDAAA